MEKLTVLHSGKAEDGAWSAILRGEQEMVLRIREASDAAVLGLSADAGMVNNHISVMSSKNACEQFPHELPVHHALNRAGLKKWSVVVVIYGAINSGEVMEAILCGFNLMMKTRFAVESDSATVRLLVDGEIVCQLPA